MKLLIVEDEYYTRKALIKIVKERYGDIESISEAENGEDALKILEEGFVDIIITDIRMPILNGLELSTLVLEKHPKTMIIIITGYSEFEYAQKALRLGIKAYILKPLQKEEIYSVLDSVVHQIDLLQNKEKVEASLKKKMEEVFVLQKLNQILQKKEELKEEDLVELLSLEASSVCYRILLVRCKKVFTEEMKTEMNTIFDKKIHLKLYYDFVNRNELILFSYGDATIRQYEESDYLNHLHLVHKLLGSHNGGDFVIGISHTYEELIHFQIAYQEAQLATYNYFFSGWGKMYFYESEIADSEFLSQCDDLFRILEHGLKSGDEVLSGQTARKIFDVMEKAKASGPQLIRSISSRFEQIINEISKARNIEIVKSISFGHYNDSKEYTRNINDIIELICKNIHHHDTDKTIVQDILKYLEKNYFNDLSLGDIANDMYFMNASYLSRIFKEETGESFSKTLLRIRMDKARELLEDKQMSVTEVASLVGYDSVAYFIKSFKSYFHMTPGQIKKD